MRGKWWPMRADLSLSSEMSSDRGGGLGGEIFTVTMFTWFTPVVQGKNPVVQLEKYSIELCNNSLS